MPGNTSRKNGRKGGRPRGSLAAHTLEAQELRRYLIERVANDFETVVNVLVSKAKKGDIRAIKELLDRVLGKEKDAINQFQITPDSIKASIEESRKRYR